MWPTPPATRRGRHEPPPRNCRPNRQAAAPPPCTHNRANTARRLAAAATAGAGARDPLPTGPGRLSAPRRPRQPRQCTVSYTYYPGAHGHGGDQPVPHLRLSGLWLEQLGFAIGAKLRITAQKGRLLIEKPESESN